MKRKLSVLLLVLVFSIVSCLPMTVMAETVASCGFYNLGTANGVQILPLRNGEETTVVAVYANEDDEADFLYHYSNSLRVKVLDAEPGKIYAATLVNGSDYPQNEADFLYTKQVTATENEVVFDVATTLLSGNMTLTLFVTSNDSQFESCVIPVYYAIENVYESASNVPLPGTLTLSGSSVITATVIGAPDEAHYDIVWLRGNAVIEGASGTTYTVTAADKGSTIKAKLVAKGSVYVGEVMCERGITVSGGGGGGMGGGGGDPTYGVTLTYSKGGSATVSTKNALANKTVTVTPKADTGYAVLSVVVTDSKNNEIEVTEENGVYAFKMPKSGVTITVTFALEEEIKPDDPTPDEPIVPDVTFADVAEGDFYYDAVLWAVANNITQGISETAFAPGNACTRAQIITFLWRAAGSPKAEKVTNVFTDVAEGSFYYDAVLWAVENGITAGTTETTFSPDEQVSRAQTVTFMYRMAGEPAPEASDAFTDVSPKAYYNNAVNWAVTNGITKGTDVGRFSPDTACTRGQIVTFIYRYLAE